MLFIGDEKPMDPATFTGRWGSYDRLLGTSHGQQAANNGPPRTSSSPIYPTYVPGPTPGQRLDSLYRGGPHFPGIAGPEDKNPPDPAAPEGPLSGHDNWTKELFDTLMLSLKSDNPSVALAAAKVLGGTWEFLDNVQRAELLSYSKFLLNPSVESGDDVVLLVDSLESDEDEAGNAREAPAVIFKDAWRFLDKTQKAGLLDYLKPLLKEKDPEVSLATAWALKWSWKYLDTTQRAGLFNTLVPLLKLEAENLSTRSASAEVLGGSWEYLDATQRTSLFESLKPLLRPILADDTGIVCGAAVNALGEAWEFLSKDQQIDLLATLKPLIRPTYGDLLWNISLNIQGALSSAWKFLDNAQQTELLAYLKQLLVDEDWNVRQSAGEILGGSWGYLNATQRAELFDYIKPLLEKDPHTSSASVWALRGSWKYLNATQLNNLFSTLVPFLNTEEDLNVLATAVGTLGKSWEYLNTTQRAKLFDALKPLLDPHLEDKDSIVQWPAVDVFGEAWKFLDVSQRRELFDALMLLLRERKEGISVLLEVAEVLKKALECLTIGEGLDLLKRLQERFRDPQAGDIEKIALAQVLLAGSKIVNRPGSPDDEPDAKAGSGIKLGVSTLGRPNGFFGRRGDVDSDEGLAELRNAAAELVAPLNVVRNSGVTSHGSPFDAASSKKLAGGQGRRVTGKPSLVARRSSLVRAVHEPLVHVHEHLSFAHAQWLARIKDIALRLKIHREFSKGKGIQDFKREGIRVLGRSEELQELLKQVPDGRKDEFLIYAGMQWVANNSVSIEALKTQLDHVNIPLIPANIYGISGAQMPVSPATMPVVR